MSAPGFLLVATLLLVAALADGTAHEFDADHWSPRSGQNAKGNKNPRFPGEGGFGMPRGDFGNPRWGGGWIPRYPGGNRWGNMGGGWIPRYPGRQRGNWWGNMGGGKGAGYARGRVVRPSVVCSDKGPCHGRRLTCPARCFTSYSRSGKNYAFSGSGGGCTMDCKKRCVAYC